MMNMDYFLLLLQEKFVEAEEKEIGIQDEIIQIMQKRDTGRCLCLCGADALSDDGNSMRQGRNRNGNS